MFRILFAILFIYIPQTIQSSTVFILPSANYESNIGDNSRAMYVDGFAAILGDTAAEDALLAFAQSREVTVLLLYDLHIVHATYDMTNSTTNGVLADFIAKAKSEYGIQQMGATAENGDFFANVVDIYNNSRSNGNEKFDIYNLEFEFWNAAPTAPGGYYCTTYLIPNGLSCSNDGAFQFFISVLETMHTLAENNSHPITTEAYVGWPTASQANAIGDNLDKLRLHAYVTNPNSAFSYSEDRLIDFAEGTPGLDVSIILSAEPSFMQSWLEANTLLEAESLYTDDWTTASSQWNNNITLKSFTYFTYSDLINVELGNCPNHQIIEDLTINADTIIYAQCLIELNNVVVNPPSELTLIAPEICVFPNCDILAGAILTTMDTGCPD